MKQLVIVVTCLLLLLSGYGQSRAEVIIEQIIKLEATLVQLKQGYAIVQKGLSVVSDLKQGDFNLHQLYFSSLQSVKAPIAGDPCVTAISGMYQHITTTAPQDLQTLQAAGSLSTDEINLVSTVFTGYVTDAGSVMQALSAVLTDGSLQMTDAQRVDRISTLYGRMLQLYSQFNSTANSLQLVARQRQLDTLDWLTLQTLLP